MRNLKELRPILTAIYCINRTNGNEDEDISKLSKYAFYRIFNGNANLLMLACLGKKKEDIMPEIEQILKEDTKFFEVLDEL